MNFSYLSNSGKISIEISEEDFIKIKKLNKIIYSCNTGGYSPTNHFKNVIKICELHDYTFIIFTDKHITSIEKANQIVFSFDAPNPRYAAKIFKILPHEFFINSEISLWIDSNVEINQTVFNNLNNFLESDYDIELFLHDKRKNIIDEASECKKMAKDNALIIDSQISKYMNKYLNLREFGLYQGRILLRKNTNEIQKFSIFWLNEVLFNSIRDQLSLPIAIKESKVNLSLNNHEDVHNFFKVLVHNKYDMYSNEKSLKNIFINIKTKIIFKLVKFKETYFDSR